MAVVTLAGALALAGCAANSSYDSNLSPAENQLRKANERFSTTVAEGAVVGALAGAALGAVLSRGNRVGGAALGAAAGGALGASAGYMVARNNASRSRTEADYNEAISQAEQDAVAYQQSATASRQIAQAALADAARLDAQYRARQISAAQYRDGLSRYQQDNEILRKQITDAQQASATMRTDAASAPGANRGRLSATAADIDASRRDLLASSQQISRVLAAVPQAGA